MNIEIFESYSPEWMDGKKIIVGIPSSNTISTKDIYERILEIQTVERGAGANLSCGLDTFMSKEELSELFDETLNELNFKGKSCLSFASTLEGADTSAYLYFFENMCAITYFKYDEKYKKSVFSYEWYKHTLQDKNVWIQYTFHEDILLENALLFLSGIIPPSDIIINLKENISDDTFNESDILDSDEEDEVINDDDEEFEIMEMNDELQQILNESIMLRDFFIGLYEGEEIAPFVNINEQMENACYSFKKDTLSISALNGGTGKVKPFGFPQNFNTNWCNINMLIFENEEGEKVVVVIKKEKN